MNVNQVAPRQGQPGLVEKDGDLLDRFHLGDATAFDELVGRYHLPLYHLAYRLTRDRAEAEDLTQEVFLRAYRSLRRFRRASSLKTWLFQIALNRWRDSRRRPQPPLQWPDGSPFDPAQGSGREAEPLASLERKEQQACLQTAIAQLPDKQRVACILRVYHDLSFKEIGEVVSSPIPTVKANYRLAVLRLRRRLEDPGLRSWNASFPPSRT